MIVLEKLQALRALMKERNMDAYIIPTSDFHETEYVGEHFKSRIYMSGFTGSAGTLVVCLDHAALWVDGRYFIQAAKELEGSSIEMMKMGEPNVPSIAEYLHEQIKTNGCLGFDGRVINTKMANTFVEGLQDKNISISCEDDLVGMVWKDRPVLPSEKAWLLDLKYSGKTSADKLNDIKEELKNSHCDMQILTTLDDIAWTLNMRGNDIHCFPVVLAYLVVTTKDSYVFLDEAKLSDELRNEFEANHVNIKGYDEIYDFVKTVKANKIMLDTTTVNYKITSNLSKEIAIQDGKSPTQVWKACKNEVELENDRHAHIKDAVAMTKFMYWLKNAIGKETITEVSAADKLEGFRKEQDDFIEISFDTIAAYNANAAMMHYHAIPETCATLKTEGLFLVDSGGQYYDGTTDITRTYALGPVSDEMKKHFTTVVRSVIALSKANFLHGCIGMNLDILARGPIWELDIDYRCGTGHGIGYVLNVHEAPNGFRWKKVPERSDSGVLEEGMITTNEPGIYLEDKYGIRIENELVTRKGTNNEYGQFLNFETITFVPIDLDAIDPSYMTQYEKEWLNAYHKEVYNKISPFLSDEVKTWLKTYTRAI